MKEWLFAAQIALIVLFVLFATLHIAWFIYIWRLDFKWKYAQAVQRECGDKVLERETVRWNMTQVFNNDAALQSLKKFTYVVLALGIPTMFGALAITVVATTENERNNVTSGFSGVLENLQYVPTPVYFTGIAMIFTLTTVIIMAKHFGRDPKKNKLADLMTPYSNSLANIQKTMELVKTYDADGYSERQIKENVVRRLGMIQDAESTEAAEVRADSTDARELIGYLRFSDDFASTELCRYVKQDVNRFTSDDVKEFEDLLTNFLEAVMKPYGIMALEGKPNDEFGRSVSVSHDGNTFVVSAPGKTTDTAASEDPSVYVYTRDVIGWKAVSIKPSSNAPMFGQSLAISGDGTTIAIGAKGNVFIFKRSTQNNVISWNPNPLVDPPVTVTKEVFGRSVALSKDGSILAVGTTDSVYIFEESDATYKEVQSLVVNAGDTETSIAFAGDGNTLVVGSRNQERGAAYVYSRPNTIVSGGRKWALQKKLLPDGNNENGFGTSVAISSDGNTVVVGAGGFGFAYVYTRKTTDWAQDAAIKSPNDMNNDGFGTSVAISPEGTVIAVGARVNDTHSSISKAGSVYIFAKSPSAWYQQKMVYADDAQTEDYFGTSVALSSTYNERNRNVLVVGASGNDTINGVDTGSAYLFEGYENLWVDRDAIIALKEKLMTSFPAASFPYFNKYISELDERNIRLFVDTWWVSPQSSVQRSFRLTKDSEGKFAPNDELWNNVITQLICTYWTSNAGWDMGLKDPKYGDPSPQLRKLIRRTKIYYGLVLIFILFVIYIYLPKENILPLAVIVLLLVFTFAYLTQFIY